ncbi:MAG: hypothetical protein EOP02_28050 [Proteobacteria bacterium]|nr:MAG: hypothetical protein EOP02_28050 [Pseudomonadota bacterium]
MSKLTAVLATLALAAASSGLQAKEGPAVADCVDLSPNYEVTRFGSQYLFVKDGESHYRIGFSSGGCDAIGQSTKVQIVTDGQANRLCPAATKIKTRRDSCNVREVIGVDADEYDRTARRNR